MSHTKRIYSFIFFYTFIFTISSLAFAHGPSRQKVVEKIEINAEINDVWKIISNFEDFSWNPLISSTEASGNEVGSLRKLKSKNDSKISQTLEKLNVEKKLVSWRIKDTDQKLLPVNSYQATILLKDKNGNVEVTYKAGFYRGFMGNDPPEELNDANSKIKVKEFIDSALKNLKNISEK